MNSATYVKPRSLVNVEDASYIKYYVEVRLVEVRQDESLEVTTKTVLERYIGTANPDIRENERYFDALTQVWNEPKEQV